MKKLINKPADVVREMLEGSVLAAPGQTLLADENVVVQSRLPKPALRKVSVISGGGSGHEPAHAGYVGTGMLTAAVAGDVFTSPSADAVLAAIRASSGPAGALLIVKNYTGDRLNFGLAAEMARAEGIPVEVVVVADDVALSKTVEKSRRRGIAGTVLVHKIAGAAAAKGLKLTAVAKLARAVAAQLGSMGVSLGPCTLPQAAKPNFELAADEIELGLGIHGEPGVEKAKMAAAASLVQLVLTAIIADLKIKRGARVALVANGLGSTPPMELSVVLRDALAMLSKAGIVVERAWCGTLLSALDMPGFSLSLLPLEKTMLSLLDAPTEAPAWPGSGKLNAAPVQRPPQRKASAATKRKVPHAAGKPIRALALAAARALSAAESRLTDLDAKAGDGDLGASMARAALAIRKLPEAAWGKPGETLQELGQTLRRAIGGSSGPFYATALMRAARSLPEKPKALDWSRAFSAAVAVISELGGAKPGDRTMVDALAPAAAAFEKAVTSGVALPEAWSKAVQAARAGAEATTKMKPRLGRASYLGNRAIGVEDAGAAAVVCWMEALERR
ncbi:MAG: dihydroxyacetone kinase family protein [Hyphomicrobiales bacterium]